MRPISCALILLCTVGTADVRAQVDLSPPPEVAADTTFGTMDYELALTALDGSTVEFSKFRDRVLFINFWASWCAPCLREMPSIDALRRRLDGNGVEVLLISVDDKLDDVRAFAAEHGTESPLYLRAWERERPPFRSALLPRTYIVSKSGDVVYRHTGAANWDSEAVSSFLLDLAGE